MSLVRLSRNHRLKPERVCTLETSVLVEFERRVL